MDIKKINIDLIENCQNIARNKLENMWSKKQVKKIEKKDLILSYFNAIGRVFIRKKPRELKLSDVFRVRDDLKEGWKFLKEKILSGDDLMPHLSRQHNKIKNRDGLLEEWNVHHLHLGTTYEKNGLITRTKALVFAVITDEKFHAINIYMHDGWADKEVVIIIDNNWPELHEQFIFNLENDDNITDGQRIALRKKRHNSFVKIGENRFLTGAISASGHQITSVMLSDIFQSRIIEAEKEIIKNCSEIIYEICSSMQIKIDPSVSELTILLKSFDADDEKIILYIPEIDCGFSFYYEHGKAENYMALFED